MPASRGERLRRSHYGHAHYKACCHCGRPTRVESLTLDHILPRSKGGRLTKKNTALACKPCNLERGSQDFWIFREQKRSEILGVPIKLDDEPPTREQHARAHRKTTPKPRVKKHEKSAAEVAAEWHAEDAKRSPRDPL